LLQKYRAASCLLHTAENATANNALLEAMACGIPIIAETVGGIPEYVNSHCATLTAPGDESALAAAIRSLASSPAKQASMSIAARSRAEELDWKTVATQMMTLYRSL
jgi:glycosyltransferase involved in cell wall biosynthesis